MKNATLVDPYDIYKGIKIKLIDVDAFKKLKDHIYTLIHVLPKEHYQNSHIKGAINICVYGVSFLAKIKDLNLESTSMIVLYGESENELDAKTAALKLHDHGFENVYVLKGGLSGNSHTLDLEGERNETDPDQLLSLEDRRYTLVDHSTLDWKGENAYGKHFGKLTLKSGNIEIKDSLLSGEFIIDMNSIKDLDLTREEGADLLEAHLQSDDFFLTKLFPEAKYTLNNIKSVSTPYLTDINYILDGELTLKGITKKQSINALISKMDDTLVLNARVEIDRTNWNIIYGSAKFFKYLGMHKIFDKILIEMRLELVPHHLNGS